jgi:FixJ family two-component response regulator
MEVLSSRLRKLQNRIKNNIEHDDDWKKFEENFDSVHENFLKQLSDKFPNLTKSEKKLSAYLRMNLVSKDIAPLLNISVRGVEISRYRLRQKLELPRDTNLTDFLQRL